MRQSSPTASPTGAEPGAEDSFSRALLIVLAASVLVIAALGYYAFINDQSANIPVTMRVRDGSYFARDWDLALAVGSHIRLAADALVIVFWTLFSSLDWGIFGAQVASTILFVAAVYYLCRTMGLKQDFVAPALAIVLIGQTVAQGVGASFPAWEPYFLPRGIGYSLYLLSLALAFRRRVVLAGIALGVTMYVHAAVGITGMITTAAILLIYLGIGEWRKIAIVLGVAGILSSPFILPLALGQAVPTSVDRGFLMGVYLFRSEYLQPHLWRWQHWLIFAAVNVHAWFVLRRKNTGIPRFLRIGIAVILALSVAQWAGIELTTSTFAYKIQYGLRMLPVWRILYLLAVGLALSDEWTRDRLLALVRWAAIGLTLGTDPSYLVLLVWEVAYLSGLLPKKRWFVLAGYVFAALAGWTTSWLVLAPLGKFAWARFLGPAFLLAAVAASRAIDRGINARSFGRSVPVGLVTCAALAALGVAFVKTYAPASSVSRHWRILRTEYLDGDLQRLAWWVRTNTPRDALFLVPPNSEGLRMWGERSIFINYKSFTLKETDVPEWYERMFIFNKVRDGTVPDPHDVTPADATRAYYDARPNEVVAAARRYGIDYFVTKASLAYPFPAVRTEGRWTLYDLSAAKSGTD